jgi:uncharacterized SAM-binding protein YcdF (DUF218 family)
MVMKARNSSEMSGTEREGGASQGGTGRSQLASLPRLVGVSLAAAISAFAIGFGLFAIHVSNLVTPRDQPAADAIIVLTGGQSRLDAALGLLESGKGRRLLISGVNPAADRDDLRAATGGDQWLFSCCVDIDHAALDTIGNAEESAKWVRGHRYASVILVTNNYHMPRSLLEMGRLLDSADLRPYPVVNTRLDAGGWLTRPDAFRVLFTEYNKYLVALARGVIPARPLDNEITVVDAAAASLD